MRKTHDDPAMCQYEIHETLFAAVSLALPQAFNIEWMIDRAERGEWGGLWW